MKTIALCAIALSLAAPLASYAASADESSTAVRVSYSDLNLVQSHDAVVLLERIKDAAFQACGASSFSLPDYQDAVRRSSCYQASVSRAVTAIDAPLVTALYGEPTKFAMASK